MQISDGEKLIIGMLCAIYKKLGIKDDIDPEFVEKALWGGHYWAIEDEISSLLHDEDRPDHVKEVREILTMWRELKESIDALSPGDRKRVEVDAAPIGADPKFRGFDGNNESAHLSISRFMIEEMGMFEEFRGIDLDSHTYTLENYRRMLAAYNSLWPGRVFGNLDADQITKVLTAPMRDARQR